MFNNAALDVVIGLVFVYLLYSLLGTLIEEMIATNIGLRGIVLKMAIVRMLDDNKLNSKKDTTALRKLFAKIAKIVLKQNIPDDIKTSISERVEATVKEIETNTQIGNVQNLEYVMSDAFYAHPLIKYLASDSIFLKKKPSYITKETFSKVVIDLLRGQNIKPGDSYRQAIQDSLDKKTLAWDKKVPIQQETLSYLTSIWVDAQGDAQRFQEYLEQWFNEMMERTTGWYKKYTQLILLFVGLIIAGAFNVDTLKIISKLQSDPKLREQIIAQANDFTKAHPNLVKELADTKKQIDSMASTSIPKDSLKATADSNYARSRKLRDSLYNQASTLATTDIKKVNNVLAIGWDGGFCKNFDLTSILGWILTALAISLGAPFWFDLLNKLMKLRSSVATKDDKDAKTVDTTKKTERVG